MAHPIYLVGGSKGGVGKSLVTMALVDFLQQARRDLLLVDSDTTNPDVARCYRDEIPTELIDLDQADGWISLVNTCESHPGSTVVINTAAGSMTAVEAFGRTLGSTLRELRRKLVALWVINRQRDSLELLRAFLGCMPEAETHVLRNAFFGDEGKFELYNASKVREAVERQHRGSSLTFPVVADRITDDIYSRRLSIARADAQMPIANRAELLRWRGECRAMFAQVIA